MANNTTKTYFEESDFEFLLTINGNIICKRYFDVHQYDKDFLAFLTSNKTFTTEEQSVYLDHTKYLIDALTGINVGPMGSMGIIPRFLKRKTEEHLWSTYNPYFEQTPADFDRRNIYDNEDFIGFKLRYKNRDIVESQFSGNYFPTKVRYEINIKDIIPTIVKSIRKNLALK
jgi:hypothetical protein